MHVDNFTTYMTGYSFSGNLLIWPLSELTSL